jgi:hypothetical protein
MPDLLSSDKVIVALAGLIGVIVGSVLTTFFAPWVKYRLDRRIKALQEAGAERQLQRDQIARWREMIAWLAQKRQLSPDSLVAALQGHVEYQALEPLLRPEIRAMIYGGNLTIVVGSVIPSVLHYLKEEVSRLEREWGLRT